MLCGSIVCSNRSFMVALSIVRSMPSLDRLRSISDNVSSALVIITRSNSRDFELINDKFSIELIGSGWRHYSGGAKTFFFSWTTSSSCWYLDRWNNDARCWFSSRLWIIREEEWFFIFLLHLNRRLSVSSHLLTHVAVSKSLTKFVYFFRPATIKKSRFQWNSYAKSNQNSLSNQDAVEWAFMAFCSVRGQKTLIVGRLIFSSAGRLRWCLLCRPQCVD